MEHISDFLLHVGETEDGLRCALLRHPGDQWISAGTVIAAATESGTFDLLLYSGDTQYSLAGVQARHIEHIRGHGLYVIQRRKDQASAEATLMRWSA